MLGERFVFQSGSRFNETKRAQAGARENGRATGEDEREVKKKKQKKRKEE